MNIKNMDTEDNKLITSEKAYQLDQDAQEYRRGIDKNFLGLAKTLKEIYDTKAYKKLDYDKFESYIAQPSLAIERSHAYRLIQIYETFVLKYSVASTRLLNAGTEKLKRIMPHVNDDDYEYFLEKAETLSLSDLSKELVDKGKITKKEPETSKFVEVDCPKCHNHFVWNILKRSNQNFPRETYNEIIKVYEKVKDTKFRGDEYRPIQQAIHTLLINGRTKEEIIAVIEYLGESAEFSWTMQTIASKIGEYLPKADYQPKKDMSEQDKLLLRRAGVEV